MSLLQSWYNSSVGQNCNNSAMTQLNLNHHIQKQFCLFKN